MEQKNFIQKLIPWAYLLLAFLSIRRYLVYNPLSTSGTTLALEFMAIFFITCFYPVYTYQLHKTEAREPQYKFFNLFLIYTLLLCIYSLFVNYPMGNKYEKMALINAFMASMSGISVFYLANPDDFSDAVHKLYKYLPVVAIVFLPFADDMWIGDMVGFLLMPILLPLIFWRDLPSNKKILYGALAVYIVLTSYWGDARSHVLKYGLAFLMGFVVFRYDYPMDRLKHLVWVIIAVPLVLFGLAVTGSFNVFEYAENMDSSNFQENSFTDTRTFLYTEALTSAVNHNYIIYGRGIGRGYDSNFAETKFDANEKSVSGAFDKERNSETSIVNTFTWGGVIYVIIYIIMTISVLYYGCYRTNNKHVLSVALYFAFYFVYCWVENFQSMTISYFSSWFFIAICLSSQFREMTDDDFSEFVSNTF